VGQLLFARWAFMAYSTLQPFGVG